MCKWGTWEKVKVKIPADLSSTGKEKWKEVNIDKCIAPLIRALQEGGIDMRGSCCGHGKDFGMIHLQDGRVLVITNELFFMPWKWAFKAFRRAMRLSYVGSKSIIVDYWIRDLFLKRLLKINTYKGRLDK